MEIDIRDIPEPARLDRILGAVAGLGRKEVLSVLAEEDPQSLIDSIKNVLGNAVDVQKVRWGVKALPWILHVKKSLKPSAYQPVEKPD